MFILLCGRCRSAPRTPSLYPAGNNSHPRIWFKEFNPFKYKILQKTPLPCPLFRENPPTKQTCTCYKGGPLHVSFWKVWGLTVQTDFTVFTLSAPFHKAFFLHPSSLEETSREMFRNVLINAQWFMAFDPPLCCMALHRGERGHWCSCV